MACHKIFLAISLMLVVSMVNAVDFSVFDNTGNSPGGRRFRDEIGSVSYGEQSLRSATDFTWRLFQQTNHSDRRDVKMITLFMENGRTPVGLIEGIADYVRLKAGYVASHWVGAGGGDRWDQGYDVTARFLDYCNDLRNGFVAELNKKMRNGYSDGYFVDLIGKDVNQLWREYKAKYGQ
ncbi:unnamed protein product [Arabidopsis arenosa]|uniref:Uncharacterized protein n=1 Tax=Arabidopsis arenosa TaxID=38785 RepID=A0A8S2A090_ARAAE|nr:unnamed protein product [Arabidopsis arenosa]